MELTPSRARIERQRRSIIAMMRENSEKGIKKTAAVRATSLILGVSQRTVYKTIKLNENGID